MLHKELKSSMIVVKYNERAHTPICNAKRNTIPVMPIYNFPTSQHNMYTSVTNNI